jgi:hypothetical protein
MARMGQLVHEAESIITAKLTEDFARAGTVAGLAAATASFGRTTDASPALGQRLARAGFYAAEVNATLVAAPASTADPEHPGVRLHELHTGSTGSYLAGAATIPARRGRGCQSALITRRLRDAAAPRPVVVTTAFGSSSQSNLQRHGFRIVHTRALWRRLA